MTKSKTYRMRKGIHTALVTPFSVGGTDGAAFERLLKLQLDSGVSGVVVLGTTGEAPTVSDGERDGLIYAASRACKGRIDITVGCGSNDTARAVSLCKRAKELGADVALAVVPYYNKPEERGILRHYLTLAEESPLPVALYNVPSRTGRDIDGATYSVLARHENVIACKEASSDVQRAAERILSEPQFDLFSGSDTLLFPHLCLGARGCISVASNIAPELTVKVADEFFKGRYKEAREAYYRLLPFYAALFSESNPAPIKAIMQRAGLINGRLRLPLMPVSERTEAKLIYAATDAGIINADQRTER